MGDPALIGRSAWVVLCFLLLMKPANISPLQNDHFSPQILKEIRAVNLQHPVGIKPAQIIQFKAWELVTALAWSPDGELVVVAAGNKLYSYNSETWAPVWEYQLGAFTPSLAFSQDGNWLVAGSRDGKLRLWRNPQNLTGGRYPLPFMIIEAHKKGVNSVVFDPAGNFLASGGNDAVARFWDMETGENLGQMIGGSFAVPAIAFAPDGKTLAVVNGNMVRLREVGSERIVGSIQASNPLYSLAYHPMGNFLATGSTEDQVELWNPSQAFRTGLENYPVPMSFSGHEGKSGTYQALIWQVVFNPQGSILATAGGDATVRIWNPENYHLMTILKGQTQAVSSIAFSPDGFYLASGSLDGSVWIWQMVEN